MVALFEALAIAEKHLADGNTEAGRELLASIAAQRPAEPAPAQLLAQQALSAGANDAAIEWLARAEQAARLKLGEITAARAAVLRQLGQTGDALALLEGFPFEHNAHVLLQLAGAYYDHERDEAAARCFEALRGIAPNDINVIHGSAAVELRLGQFQSASARFEQAARARFAIKESYSGEQRTWKITALRHCHDQLAHLANVHKLPAAYAPALEALASLRETLVGAAYGACLRLSGPTVPPIARALSEFVHYQPPAQLASSALNGALDFAAVEQAYHAAAVGIEVVDDLLSAPALHALNEFFIDSTIWHTAYDGGYVGAFVEDGIFCPLLAQIAEELQQAMPTLLGRHALHKVWAFKYFSDAPGIGVHADDAAVNINLWLTPDEARLPGADGGGLLIWDTPPPGDWNFTAINNSASTSAMQRFIQDSGAKAVNVPYRANRAAIFCSDLFHQGTPVRFKPGYRDRRINLTFLFGRRGANRADNVAAASRLKLLEQAVAEHRAGALEAAKAGYAQVLRSWPNDADALHLSGRIALDEGDPERAQALIQAAAQHAPDNAHIVRSLGDAAKAQGRADEAREHYAKAHTMEPAAPEFIEVLAQAEFECGHVDQARRLLEQGVRKCPTATALKRNLAIVLQHADTPKPEEAVARAERLLGEAINAAPRDAIAHINLGMLWAKQTDFTAAAERFRHVLTLETNQVEAHLRLAHALYGTGDFDEGLKHAASARCLLQAHTDMATALALESRLLLAETEPAQIESWLQRKGDSYAGLIGLGNALRHRGELCRAITAYRRAAELEPDNHLAHRRLATALALNANMAQADASIRRARACLDTDTPTVENAICLRPDFLAEQFPQTVPDDAAYEWSSDDALTILASADRDYFLRFAKALVSSFMDNAQAPVRFHFHVVNPDPAVAAKAQALRGTYGADIALTTEHYPVDALITPKTYYACARFLALPEVIEKVPGAVLIADMDLLCLRGIGAALHHLTGQRAQLGVFALTPKTYDLWDHFQASALFIAPTAAARAAMDGCAAYIRHFFKADLGVWYLDQIALFAALLQARANGTCVSELPIEWLALPTHNPLAPETAAPGEAAIFWSLLSSVPANQAYYSHATVVKYMESTSAQE
ncbi:MAG: tetratricopeptide repeat protein [Gammaproteobacteria bacterium]|nr:tetratricopeptide repeat protein [Gammaproteobacteria bacterium]